MWTQDTPVASPAAAAARGAGPTTWVDLVWYERRIEHWIRFGRVRDEVILDRRRRRLGFRPGDVFAFVRWQANDRGTVQSRIDILQALGPGEGGSTTPGVHPGGERLLHLTGWPKVQRVLAAIDAVELIGVDPTDAAPDYWRHLHNRLGARQAPDAYSLVRHRAWRLRAELDS
jgi:hypothetical protein